MHSVSTSAHNFTIHSQTVAREAAFVFPAVVNKCSPEIFHLFYCLRIYTKLSSGRRIIHSFCKINNFKLECSIIVHSFRFFKHDCLRKSLSQQLKHNMCMPLKHTRFDLFTSGRNEHRQYGVIGVRMTCFNWPIELFPHASALHVLCRKFFSRLLKLTNAQEFTWESFWNFKLCRHKKHKFFGHELH